MTESVVIRDSGTGDFRDDSGPIAAFPGSGAVSSVFGRTGTVLAVAGDYFAVLPAALTGAMQAFRLAGATTSGAPVSGTFAVGDLVAARDGHLFMCISAGTPGTWVDTGGSVSFATPALTLDTTAAAGSAGTAIRTDATIPIFNSTAPSAQAFGDSAAAGSTPFAERQGHKHAMPATPVTTINKTGSTALTGAVTLTGGTNVTLTQAGNDISIAAATGTVYTPTDGWVDASGQPTWTYASASTFTIAGVDLTAVFTPGTRLKFTQTTVKYATVASSSFSTNTTVTIIVNTDHVLANAAISANYYSYMANPQGYPGWFTYDCGPTGFSGTPTQRSSRFAVVGRTCTVYLDVTGTSNASGFTLTLPVAAQRSFLGGFFGGNNGAAGGVTALVQAASAPTSTLNIYSNAAAAGWNTSGTKQIETTVPYEF